MSPVDDFKYRSTVRRIVDATVGTWTLVAVFVWVAGFSYASVAGEVSDYQSTVRAVEGTVDMLAKKDIVWLSLLCAIGASLACIVQTVLLFWLSINSVRALDRMASRPCQLTHGVPYRIPLPGDI